MPHNSCCECGGSVAYINDNTVSVARQTPAELSESLTTQYQRISEYMAANGLVINNLKTHLLVFSKRSLNDSKMDVKIHAGNHIVTPSDTEKLLGIHISQTLKCQEHIQNNQKSLLKQLNTRINGLALISKRATFQSRLMIAQGLVLSKMSYLIQVWGGTNESLIRSLQVSLNKTARIVTRLSWFTPTGVLMRQCNWLSVEKMVQYYTLVTVFNIVRTGKPKYLYDKLCHDHQYNTRTVVKYGETFSAKSALASNSFCYRGALLYQQLPAAIRDVKSAATFKKKAKDWIKTNTRIK